MDSLTDLFGHTIKQRKARPIPLQKQGALLPAVQPVMREIRRPVGKVAAQWQAHGWEPGPGQITHFHAGYGFNLSSLRRMLMSTCFGYILAVNERTGEVVVHLPKPLLYQSGEDQFFVAAFHDLLPPQSVEAFDATTYRADYPVKPCPFPVSWDVTADPY